MATKHIAYLTTYNLSELDMQNIRTLEEKTGQVSSTVIHQAVAFCKLSLDYAASGYQTSVIYDRYGYRYTTASLKQGAVARIFNARSADARKVDLTLYRSSLMLQGLHDIKQAIKTENDSVALGYALEYAAQMVHKLENANGGKNAHVFITYNNSPRERGWLLTKHPYDISLGNSFRKAARKMKRATVNLFKKEKPTIRTQIKSPN